MTRVWISDDAIQDLNDGFLFYEAQEAGLGDYFVASLRSDIEGLKVSGGVHPLVYHDHRRALSRVFPYAIYYTQAPGEATVWAVVDCRRNPDWIMAHLQRIQPPAP